MNNNLVALVIVGSIQQVKLVSLSSIGDNRVQISAINQLIVVLLRLGVSLLESSAGDSFNHQNIRSGVGQLVLSAVDLNLLSIVLHDFQIAQNAGSYDGAVLSVDAVNSGLVAGSLVQNINIQAVQVGVVLRRLQNRLGIASYSVGEFILVLIIGDVVQFANCFFQTHVLLADGRVVVVSALISRGNQVHVGVLAVAQNYGVCENRIVDQLCSVLTRASCSEGSGYVLQQAVLVSQCVGLGCPACAGQTSLGCVVTQGYEQHLSCFLSGYLVVRAELGVALISNDAQGLAVLDVAACPVGANIGEGSLVVVVRRSIRVAAGTDGVDHLRHLRTGYSAIGLERAISVAIDNAQCH